MAEKLCDDNVQQKAANSNFKFKKKVDETLKNKILKATKEYDCSQLSHFSTAIKAKPNFKHTNLCQIPKWSQRKNLKHYTSSTSQQQEEDFQDVQLPDNPLTGFGVAPEETTSEEVASTSSQNNQPFQKQIGSKKNTPFDDETTIFENKSLKIYIFRKDFQRQKKFSLDDHLFLMKIETLHGKPPLLLDIEDVLMQACEDILKKIKEFYKQGKYSSFCTNF